MTDEQIVTIGNAYELMWLVPRVLNDLGPLAVADDAVVSQKAMFWWSANRPPDVAVVTRSLTDATAETLRQALPELSIPHAVTPRRRTTSISLDLINDPRALQDLCKNLDPRRPVLLEPYIWTPQVLALADVLRATGFSIPDYSRTVLVTQELEGKAAVQDKVFDRCDIARVRRPRTWRASSVDGLTAAVEEAARVVDRIVVKSSRGAGGAGVFELDSSTVLESGFTVGMLLAVGYNDPFVEAPFLVEEYVPHYASPTTDAVVEEDGRVRMGKLAVQRLFDSRYYTGFSSRRAASRSAWSSAVTRATEDVGLALRDLGFLGHYNVDFVLSEGVAPTVVELNPRRSALQDGYGLVTAGEASGRMCHEVSVLDYLPCLTSDIEEVLGRVERFNDSDSVQVLVTSDAGVDTDFHWITLIAISWDDVPSAEEMLASCVSDLTAVPNDPDAMRECVGELPLPWPT